MVKKPEDLPIQRVAKRPNRRIQKNMCLSPTDPYSGMLTTGEIWEKGNGPRRVRCCANTLLLVSGVSVEPDNHWGSQINQLEELMDKLDCEVGGKSALFRIYIAVFFLSQSKSFTLYLAPSYFKTPNKSIFYVATETWQEAVA